MIARRYVIRLLAKAAPRRLAADRIMHAGPVDPAVVGFVGLRFGRSGRHEPCPDSDMIRRRRFERLGGAVRDEAERQNQLIEHRKAPTHTRG